MEKSWNLISQKGHEPCDSLGWQYVCLCRSWVVIGQFGCSGLPPSDAKGKLAIENEAKNISTRYNFLNLGLNHTKLSDCDDWIAVL